MNLLTQENIRIQFSYTRLEIFLEVPTMGFGTDLTDQEEINEKICDAVYMSQGNNPDGLKIDSEFYSVSKGDLVWIEDDAYFCASTGWKKLNPREVMEWAMTTPHDRSWLFDDEL